MRNRLAGIVAMVAVMGLAACGTNDAGDNAAVTDTLVTRTRSPARSRSRSRTPRPW